ncbi:STAS domain-containing protein [Streptomyces sp. IBSNAI002]|uniref:STAS domain-containing protein n=1 Tax=Streptomyces sp. IBSNAI002 TaxID=3457500 RepID=UPI003FD40031
MISSPIVTSPALAANADEEDTSGIDLSCTSHCDFLRVRLAGEVDHFSAAPLRIMLAAAAAYGYRHVDLDTRAVTFCDSALLAAISAWCHHGRTVSHTSTSKTVRRLLTMERDLACRKAPGACGVRGR